MGLRNIFGSISDAIPNEFSKLAGYADYLNFIPVIGPALSTGAKLAASADNFGETYSNGGSIADSISHGLSGFSGSSADPNYFSGKNYGQGSDSLLKIGQVGNFLPSFNPSQANSYPMPVKQQELGGLAGLMNNYGNFSFQGGLR